MQQAFQNRIDALKNETIPSGGGVANIIDEDAPVINNIEIVDVTSSSITIKVNGQEIESGVNSIEYGISTAQNISNYSQDATSPSATTHTFYNLLDYTTYNIGVRITDKSSNTNTYTTTATTVSNLEVAKSNNMLNKQDNTRIKVQNNYIWIPAGYKVAQDSGLTVDAGIVITDASLDGNEWVWVPVPDATEVYEQIPNEQSQTPLELSGNIGVTTKRYSKSGIITGSYGTRSYPGDTSTYREPDIVTNCDNDTRAQATGFDDLEDMAKTIVDEYDQMIRSLEKYGGFYIGRYELSLSGVKKGKEPLTSVNWYVLYKACKNLSADNSKAISRMIWGCQWDVTCNWIASEKEDDGITIKYSITSSRKWGNYSDSLSPANVVVDGVNKYGSKQVTGYSEYWKTKNIYDFAGNCREWTQEAYRTGNRANRGGDFSSGGNSFPASRRDYLGPDGSAYVTSSRPTLILLP